MQTLRNFFIGLAALVLASCGGPTVSVRDGPPRQAVDLDAIPDAVPRADPPSRYSNKDYVVWGKRYAVMPSARGYVERGLASWYGTAFHGKPTSSGEPYDLFAMTAAHKHLPLPTYAQVTNLDNGKTIVVRVNDRGPFVAGRLIDLSYVAAAKLGISGTGRVEVRAISVSPDEPRYAATPQPSAPAPGAATSESGLYLQAGAFGEQHRAQAAQTRLQTQLAVTWPVSMVAVAGLWRVKIGPLPDRTTAVQLREQLGAQGWETQLLLPPSLRLQ